jgi:hypothetical protein
LIDGSTTEAEPSTLEQLANNPCLDCDAPGGARTVYASITPQRYDGGPLELDVRLANPDGVINGAGHWRIAREFFANHGPSDQGYSDWFDFLAHVPENAWRISDDGTVARLVLTAPGGLVGGTEYGILAMVYTETDRYDVDEVHYAVEGEGEDDDGDGEGEGGSEDGGEDDGTEEEDGGEGCETDPSDGGEDGEDGGDGEEGTEG